MTFTCWKQFILIVLNFLPEIFFSFTLLIQFFVLISFLMVTSDNFIFLHLLIEMQSLCFYLLAAFKKNLLFCVDAGLKYLIFSSIIFYILLFSISLLYCALKLIDFQNFCIILFYFLLN